ncbi:MAG: InlB B-repeat-containing protein, partial [Paludibacteraceae bacterium]|nr:InlB B-repeat-containing protein [Paludibacteraceae bacterium]
MKMMNLKSIFSWLYAIVIDRAMNHSVYRPVSVSYVARISLVSLFLLVLGGLNSEVWGASWWPYNFYAKLIVNTSPSGCGKVIVDTKYTTPTAESDWEDIKSGLAYNNATVTFYISIQANEGYELSSWSNDTPTYEKTQSGYMCYKYDMNTSSKDKNNPATKTITANFTPKEYTVLLDRQSGTGGTASVTTTYNSTNNLTSSITTPTRKGYTFGGYYTDKNGTGSQLITANGAWVKSVTNYTGASGNNPTWVKDGGVTLYAKWTANSYTVTFNANGGTVGTASKSVTYDATYGDLPVPTRSGYAFVGWFTEESSGTQIAASTKVAITDAQTLYAHWLANYSVVFNANGGNGTMTAQSFVQGTAQNLKTNAFSRTGYDFSGWATSADGNVVYTNEENVNNLSTTGNAEIPLFAKWTAHTYSVAFNGNGNTSGSMSNQGFTYDEAAKALTTNTFAKSYTVTFNANGGTCGTASMNGISPFLGWATSDNGEKVYDDEQSVRNLTAENNGTVNLYAKWGVGSIVLPTATGETNLDHLEGWFNGEEKVGDAGSAYTPTSNVDLTAHWTREQLTPSFGGENTALKVGAEQTSAFSFNNTEGPVAHIDVTAIDAINDGSGKVIEYNAETNTIIARNAGTATIYFTQAETEAVKAATSDTLTYTVTKNDPAFSGSAYNNLKVDDVQTADYTYSNTSALVPSASAEDDFYFTVDDIVFANAEKNKGTNLVTYNPSTKEITANNAGTGKITLHQKETYKFNAGNASFAVAISKYTPSFSGSAYNDLKVDDVQSVDYAYSNTSAAKPSASAEDDFYFTIDDIEFANVAKNNGNALVTYDAVGNSIIANNAGTGKITVHQKENYKYEGRIQSFNVAIGKYPNTIYVKGETNYSSSIGLTDVVTGVTLTATNTDYLNSPFEVTQTSGSSVAAFDQGAQTITALGTASTASWSVTQPENYKYQEGTASFSATVSQAEKVDCNVLENQSDDQSVWYGNTCHEHTWSDENAAGVVHFQIYKNGGSIDPGYKVQQYLNGEWQDVTSKKTDHTTDWTWKSEALNSAAKGVRIWGSGSLYNHVKNVYVTRATYLNAANITITKQADGNTPVYPSTEGKGSLSVSYSISNGGSLMLSCDNSKFEFKDTKTSATGTPISLSTGDCESGTLNIPVYFSATKEGNDTAHVVIYNNAFRTTATIISTTIKRTPVVTAPTAKDLTYTGSAQALVNAGSTTGGTLQYSLDGTNYSISIPQATNAGDYTVYYKVVGNDNYDDVVAASISAPIAKANAVLTNAPTAVAGLVYNGSAQTLVNNDGCAIGGAIQYSLDDEDYAAELPTATSAGAHTVYYKVVGDANHSNTVAQNFNVTIGTKALTVTADNKAVTYGNAAPEYTASYDGFIAGESAANLGGELAFACEYTAESNVGTYTITPSGLTSGNYNITFIAGTLTVSRPEVEITAPEADLSGLDATTEVTVSANITIDEPIEVYSLEIADNTTVTIAATGGLNLGVGGLSKGENAKLVMAAETEGANKGETGYIRVSPDYEGEMMPQAEIEMFSVGYYNRATGDAKWQYVGVPVNMGGALAKTVFTGSYIYSWSETT